MACNLHFMISLYKLNEAREIFVDSQDNFSTKNCFFKVLFIRGGEEQIGRKVVNKLIDE